MPKSKAIPADWKPFRLANGEIKYLPPFASEPLGFDFDASAALRRGAFLKAPTVKKASRRKALAR